MSAHEIKIDEDGCIYLKRKGEWVLSNCPHADSVCQHECPLLVEAGHKVTFCGNNYVDGIIVEDERIKEAR